MGHDGEYGTHSVCNERLAEKGGQALCCICHPHPGCEFLRDLHTAFFDDAADKDEQLEARERVDYQVARQYEFEDGEER